MVYGLEETFDVLKTMEKLELCVRPVFSKDMLDYVVRYGGTKVVLWNSHEDDEDEFDLTKEELEILCDCDPTYEQWYGNKVLDDILLEVEGEDDERK